MKPIRKRFTFEAEIIALNPVGVSLYYPMKNLSATVFLLLILIGARAQSSLFDDTRVSTVCIEISPDSLEEIMEEVLSDHYFQSRFIFDDGIRRDTLENVGFRLRGNTSRYAQKKSFKLSFNEYVPGRRYQEVKKLNLNGQHNDPSLIREKLFYDTWKQAGLPERRSSFVKLYINNEYYGVYTNLEEYDKDWLERVFGENDGNLYKCNYPADLVYKGSSQTTYKESSSSSATGGRAYDLQTNEAEDDYAGLVNLISTLSHSPDTTFVRLVNEILDVDMVLKAFAMDVVTGNWDDYMYNKNNYYLYQGADGKFRFIAYDTDNSFGVDWVNRDWATRNCLDWLSHSGERPLATSLFSVPEFFNKYRCYLDTLAGSIINPDSIFPRIDYLHTLITEAALDDPYRTRDFGYSAEDFLNSTTTTIDNHTPYGIKPFLAMRQAKVIEQLSGNSTREKEPGNGFILNVFPNPSRETVKLSLKGLKDTATVRLTDLQGLMIEETSLAPGTKTVLLRLAGLPSGLYLITVEVKGQLYSRKILHP